MSYLNPRNTRRDVDLLPGIWAINHAATAAVYKYPGVTQVCGEQETFGSKKYLFASSEFL